MIARETVSREIPNLVAIARIDRPSLAWRYLICAQSCTEITLPIVDGWPTFQRALVAGLSKSADNCPSITHHGVCATLSARCAGRVSSTLPAPSNPGPATGGAAERAQTLLRWPSIVETGQLSLRGTVLECQQPFVGVPTPPSFET